MSDDLEELVARLRSIVDREELLHKVMALPRRDRETISEAADAIAALRAHQERKGE